MINWKKLVKSRNGGEKMELVYTILGILFLVVGFGFAMWDEFLKK